MCRPVQLLSVAMILVSLTVFVTQLRAIPATNVLADGTPPASRCSGGTATGSPVASPDVTSATPIPVASPDLTDTASVVRILEARGLTVVDAGPLDQPFFTPTHAYRLAVTGDALAGPVELQVYEYADSAHLASDVAQVEPDGNLRTVMIEWIAAPHFFCRDQIMVVYLGDDQEALDLLTALFGPQFAGR